jgi:nicotinate dehydrogenase subunit B
MSAARDVSRRVFLETSGALLIGFALAPQVALSQDRPAALPGSLNTNRMLDAWLRIDPNGTVTIFTGKIELGQGIGTALAQIAADELDVNLERIQIVSGDTARTPNEGLTAGSLSMEQSGTALRFACAEARDVLVSAAAVKRSRRRPEGERRRRRSAQRRGRDVLGARGKRGSQA